MVQKAYVPGSRNDEDGLTELTAKDDPARKIWGTKWRTPTKNEFEELMNPTKCEWTWDAEKKGYTIKSLMNGNIIFLPAVGLRYELQLNGADTEGFYMSSTLASNNQSAQVLHFYTNLKKEIASAYRFIGYTVRAVTEY